MKLEIKRKTNSDNVGVYLKTNQLEEVINKVNKRLINPVKIISENGNEKLIELPGDYSLNKLSTYYPDIQVTFYNKYEYIKLLEPILAAIKIEEYNKDIDYWLSLNSEKIYNPGCADTGEIFEMNLYMITRLPKKKIIKFIEQEDKKSVFRLIPEMYSYRYGTYSYNNPPIPIKLNKDETLIRFQGIYTINLGTFDYSKVDIEEIKSILNQIDQIELPVETKTDNVKLPWYKKLINKIIK